ncbi:MAG: 50S ribosomal protein L11 methyltransferase, partial [Candidatus Neomarinimicrobiota bacterium]|nr:50S ribosomal protein L11 methyltransferase [Candidatus Neomarinimicrobiota bacterium]
SVDIELLHTSNYKNIFKFDIIIANILLKTIISLKEKLLSSLNANGKLLITGILNDQAKEIISAFSPEISLNIITEQEGWLLLFGENN